MAMNQRKGGGRESRRDRGRQMWNEHNSSPRKVTFRKASTVLDLPKVMIVSSAWMCSSA